MTMDFRAVRARSQKVVRIAGGTWGEGLLAAWNDLVLGFGRWPLWLALASGELRQRFHRTAAGILWVTLAFGLFCAAKVLVFGAIFQVPFAFYSTHLILGFLAWHFISGAITDGCNVFTRAESWIKGVPLPLSVFVFAATSRIATIGLYNAGAAVILIALIGYPVSTVAMFAIPAVALFLLTAVFVQLLLATICAAVGDVGQMVQTGMRIMFFLTPILWLPSQLGEMEHYAYWNPFTHYIAIFRAPILEGQVPWESWGVALIVTATLGIAALAAFGHARKRIALWL